MSFAIDTSVREYQKVQFTTVASSCLLIYDWMITFSDEVELIWYSPWNAGKVLFFATRYLAFVDCPLLLTNLFISDLSEELCDRIFYASGYIIAAGTFAAAVIMSIRIYALWGRARLILVTLVSSILICCICAIITHVRNRTNNALHPTDFGVFGHCSLGSKVTNGYLFIFYATTMSSESVIVLLTLWKGTLQWREKSLNSPLIIIFYRDGLLYFVCLFALSTANFAISFLNAGDGYFNYLLLEMQNVSHSVLSARIILNMREASRKATIISEQDQSDLIAMDFAIHDASVRS